MDLCHTLELQLNKGAKEADRLRKRVIASIGGWLRLTGKQHTIDTIKSIACRATGYSDFNKIPNERLRNLYNTFRNKQKDMDAAERIAMELLAQSYTTGATSPAILN